MVLTSVLHAVASMLSCRHVVFKQLLKGTESMSGKLKPAVGYVRMSTDKQEDGPAQQKSEIEKLAKSLGYRILRWYEDHGISGAKTNKRPEFRTMIRDAEVRGDFKAILCWDQDRFGRFDSIEAGEWISPLRRVRELVRAEILPRFPFSLTTST
jgi:hypothetical protein